MSHAPSEQATSGRRANIVAGFLLLAILMGGIAAFWLTRGELPPILSLEWSAEKIAEEIRSWGPWAVIGSMLLMIAHSFVPFPSEFIAIANGMIFGIVLGTLVTWTGAMLGAILSFALARWLGRPFVQAVLPARHANAIDEWAQKQGTGILLISRFLPVVSFNVINYAAGLTSVSWWTFLWTTGLGIIPLTSLMVIAGEQMLSGSGKTALFIIAVCIAISALWIAIVCRRRNGKHGGTGSSCGS